MLYFHYATDDFKLTIEGEKAKLFGYKEINNRRVLARPNERHSNIIKSSFDDFVQGILYELKDENEIKFSDSKETEKISVSVTKEDSTVVTAITFRAKPEFTFGDGRIKTDYDTNLTGQLLGSDKTIQRDKARTNIRERIMNYNEFKQRL